MPVLVIKDGYQTEYSCAEWEMMPANKNGYTLISQDCGNESQNNGAHQAPYAYGYSTQSSLSSGDKNYKHDQQVAAAVWTIVHNLNKYPSVTALDTAGTKWRGAIHHISDNELTITFNFPFSGFATLN